MATKNEQLPIQGYDDHDAFQLQPQFAANVRNVRSLRERIVRSPGGTNLAPTPQPFSGSTTSGFGVVVGNFKQNAAAGTQTITHNLGVTPKALILFGNGAKALSTRNEVQSSFIGFTDGVTSLSIGATNNTVGGPNPPAVTDSVRTYEHVIYAQMVANVEHLASFLSWSDTVFSINWAIPGPNAPRYVGYMIIGGAAIQTKVLEWTLGTSTGNQSVSGVGFGPQAVIHLTANRTAIGRVAGAQFGIGAMDSTRNWAMSWAAADNITNHQVCASMRKTDQAVMMVNTAGAIAYQASLVSLDSNGFTVNVQNAPASGQLIASLCMAGFDGIRVDTITPSPATVSPPANQSWSGFGFQPTAFFAASVPAEAGTVPQVGSNFDMGATDGTNQYTAAGFSQNNRRDAGDEAQKSNVVLDIFGGGVINSAIYNRQAGFYMFDTDGYTLKVVHGNNANHSVLAFNQAATGTTIGNVGIPRNYPEVYVGPSGPAIQKYVMLTSASAFIYAPTSPTTGIFTPTAESYSGGLSRRFSIANTQGIAAWSQGVDMIRQWDGTTFTDLVTVGTNQAADTLLAFNDRIIAVRPTIAGVLRPTQIRWCVNGNVNDWSGTGSGSLEIIETSQAPLTGGFVLGDRCYLTKQRELIELVATGTLNPVFATQDRVSGMGLLAPHSVGLAEQFAFWLGPDDVYMWDGSTLTAVGDRIYNTLTSFIDFQQLDQIQGCVYQPDSQYWLVIPPYIFIYDYRRDIWDWDDVFNFAAIGVYTVSNPFDGPLNFYGDIDKSEFIVVGDPQCTTTRVDFQATSWLGNPIDSYFETKDYTAEDLIKSTLGGGWHATLWDINSLREVRFQSIPSDIVEVAVSLDRGATWVDVQNVTVNNFGVGVAWFQRPFSQVRFRFRRYSTDAYEIRGQWGHDVENSGYQYG
jgi:hypothetical protein